MRCFAPPLGNAGLGLLDAERIHGRALRPVLLRLLIPPTGKRLDR